MIGAKTKLGWAAPGLMVLALIVIVVARLTAEHFDFAVANIITLISGFVFYTTGLVWWLRVGKASWRLKLGVIVAPAFVMLIGLCFYKPLGFDSELFPRFRYRWRSVEIKSPAISSTPSINADNSALAQQGTTDYSGFMGTDRKATLSNARCVDLNTWTETTPELLWSQAIGPGWSAFSVVGEIAVTLEQAGENESLRAYALKSGELLWKKDWNALHSTSLGGVGPRSTPVIANGIVYAQGANGYFVAAKLENGETVWDKQLLEVAGITVAEAEQEVAWGRAASPLVVDGQVVIPLGGIGEKISTLISFDAATGEEKWRAGTDQVSYASPTLMVLKGVPQIVSVNRSSVTSHRVDNGEILWKADWPGASNGAANVSQPVAIDDERVLLSKGYSTGAKMLKIQRDSEERWSVQELWADSSVLKTKYTNVVVHAGYAFALSDGILECVDLSDGKRMWKSKRYRHGQIMLVGEDLLVVAEDGSVAIGKASPQKFVEAFKFQAIEGMTWNNPALAGDLLLVRNGEQAACYRLPIEYSEVTQPSQSFQ